MSGKAPTARSVALAALGDRAGNVTAHLNRLLAQSPPPPDEAALARELTLGVVRRRATLDAVLAAFLKRRRGPEGRFRDILHLGAYQLLYLERVPAFAAVNEAVAQVSFRKGKSLRGFANALLRNLSRSLSDVEPGPAPLASDVISVSASAFRRIDRPVFPDPQSDRAGFLAAAGSLPAALAEKWLADFGSVQAAMAIAIHANARPPTILRVNAARTTVSDVLERLAGEGVGAVPHANGLSVVLTGGVDLAALDVFTEGLVQAQDPAATAVIAEADVRPDMRVLDLCAAPGTKTMHLAERMANRGIIVAADVSAEKLARIADGAGRMGATIVKTILAEDVISLAEDPFDLVLVDAPCSNTGVLARRAEARWRFSLRDLRSLARDQEQLLYLATEMTAPGGSVVYSTCSIENEENGQVVRKVLDRQKHFRLVSRRRVRPAGADDAALWSDGGYSAVLKCS